MPLPRFVSRTIHHEALDWATRVSANDGTISTTVLRAVSDFCAAIDRNSLRSSMCRLNPFAGGNLSGCLVPLYRSTSFGGTVIGNATDTNNNFVSADFVETESGGGLKGNGTNKSLDTGLTPNNVGSFINLHLSASGTSLETSGTATVHTLVGSYFNAASNAAQLFARNSGGYGRGGYVGNFTTTQGANTSSESHIIVSRTAYNALSLYQGGSSVASSSAAVTTTSSTVSFSVFSLQSSNYTAATLRMYSIGLGLTGSQAAAFSAAVASLNTALGR
jgi:hypothetical protein